MSDEEQAQQENNQTTIKIGDIGGNLSGNIAGRDIVINEQRIFQGPVTIIEAPPLLPSAEAQGRRNLAILLKNIETSWIKGVLEKSVHAAVLLDLGKEIHVEAVDHPWEMVLDRPDKPHKPWPASAKISTLFDEMPLLLILGEPGSGKTVTLLELARDLIAKVKTDPTFTQPIPVVFNLSTWTNQQQGLSDWIVEELEQLTGQGSPGETMDPTGAAANPC